MRSELRFRLTDKGREYLRFHGGRRGEQSARPSDGLQLHWDLGLGDGAGPGPGLRRDGHALCRIVGVPSPTRHSPPKGATPTAPVAGT